MSTTQDFRDFVLEQLRLLDEVTCKPMMGEYLLYNNGILFGGIYDNRLLVKITKANEKFGLSKELPYDGAKPMFMIDDIENAELLKEIVMATCDGLKNRI